MSKKQVQFWHETGYAAAGGASRPTRQKRTNMKAPQEAPERKWSARNILGECLREKGYCPHVGSDAKPPVHVHGLAPEHWLDRLARIEAHAASINVTYKRGDRVMKRKLRSDTPILLMAVASYPKPPDLASMQRDRWEKLVVEAAQVRWGECLRSVIAHTDEGHYHLHLWIDAGGEPVKNLHMGHAAAARAAAGGRTRAQQGQAYKRGCREIVAWHHATVGAPMGWEPRSDAPRPRIPRSAAIARRVRELEDEAIIERARVAGKLAQEQEAVSEREAQVEQREIQLEAKRSELIAEKAEVDFLRKAITDQDALAARLRDRSGTDQRPAGC